METIEDDAFRINKELKSITFQGYDTKFNNLGDYFSGTLYVPASAKSDYEKMYSGTVREYLATGATGWTTGAVSYDATLPDSTAAYVVTDVTSDAVVLHKIEDGVIPAGKGILFNAVEGQYNLEPTSASHATLDSKLTVASDAKYDISDSEKSTADFFVLAKSDDKTVAFRQYTGAYIPRGKGYLKLDRSPSALKARSLSISFSDDEATGIADVSAADEAISGFTDGYIYDLQGRHVQTMQKGRIYIVNGKKIIVK